MRPLLRPLLTLAAVLAVGGSLNVTFAQPRERCFPETGYCLSGRVLEFWEQNGGLAVFGYPTGPQQAVVVEGQSVQAQQFERNRLELHPEAPPPYDVQLGRLGAQVLERQGRDWASFPKGDPAAPFYFAETGQAVAPAFVAYWQAHGLDLDGQPGASLRERLALLGLPLSGPVEETLSDGQVHTVQYFERARLELHVTTPEADQQQDRDRTGEADQQRDRDRTGEADQQRDRDRVMLGLLGNETCDQSGNGSGPAYPAPQPGQPAQHGQPTTTPQAGQPSEPPQTGQPAEPPQAGQPAEPPQTGQPSEPPQHGPGRP